MNITGSEYAATHTDGVVRQCCHRRLTVQLGRLCAVFVLLSMAACAQYTDKRGLEVTWRPVDLTGFSRGQTTRSEVLTTLGPPSQVISLDDETVLYYLFEKSKGEALILLVYNRFDVATQYDRAVFFFDRNDRLTEFSTRISQDES